MKYSDKHTPNRVVISGMGLVSSLGSNVSDVWQKMSGGISGIKEITHFDTSDIPCKYAGWVSEFEEVYSWGRMDRYLAKNTKMIANASISALKDASYDQEKPITTDFGMILGSAFGNYHKTSIWYQKFARDGFNGVTPMDSIDAGYNSAMDHVAIILKAKGVHKLLATGCASSLDAIGSAFHCLKNGRASILISGGYENIFRELCYFFSIKGLLAAPADVQSFIGPFDRSASGMLPGEGCAAVILENIEHATERHARMYAEVVGFSKAFVTVNDDDGTVDALLQVMINALQNGGVLPDQIDYICASGNGNARWDRIEARALQKVFNYNTIYTSSIKGAFGELYGASGVVQTIMSIMSMRSNLIPGTQGCRNPIIEGNPKALTCTNIKHDISHILINSFDCFGFVSCLIIKKI
jgi:3-oxoacyl-[acyl-carrier-protein] synthase II